MLSNPKGHIRRITAGCLLTVAAVTLLSPVLPTYPELPAGEMVGQWVWIDRMMMVAAACMAVAAFLLKRGETVSPVVPLSVALLAMGSIEAVGGWRQLFGWTASGHSLYLLTGSFFNPGPYSGYLAMVLPVCLHEYLSSSQKIVRRTAGVVGAVILCVLPAGMSRSAWIAAGVACLWVYACHAGWGGKWKRQWREHRKRTTAWLVCGVCVLVLLGSGLFLLKPDSARGRFFMWRMACHAIAEQPWSGHGNGSFAAAYGDAQEAYFAAGDYEAWEERVAGSPEYAFNEYLQIAVEWGVPCLLGVLIAMGGGIYAGMKKKRYGIVGALLSLSIFAFSSYPLQLPIFVVTGTALLVACMLRGQRTEWLAVGIIICLWGGLHLQKDKETEQACYEWGNARILYRMGAYEAAEKEYEKLFPLLKDRGNFLFEYGHGLHKQNKTEISTQLLKLASRKSCDPMVLNIIGKNYQQEGNYKEAEQWLWRAVHRLPSRIYPYYLLAKLYAEPTFSQPQKLQEMIHIVLTKNPKVESTATKDMRKEIEKIKNELNKK